jgi:RES domain-containing protein
MLVYRLTTRTHATKLDGKGAELFGGRWNSKGNPVVYAAEFRSLAVLEYRVNNPLPVQGLTMVTIQIPDDSIQQIQLKSLPNHWQRYSYQSPTVLIGDNFLKAKEALCLWVPSVVVPQERNILINPLHPKIIEVKLLDEQPFLIDQKMFS